MFIRCFKLSTLFSFIALSPALASADSSSDSGYYGSAKVFRSYQKVDSMETSLRPGIGQFIPGDEKKNFYNASLAMGYQYGNHWRTEGEYTFEKKASYTSGSTRFPTSLNHHDTESQRFLINAYRDFDLIYGFSIYGMAGLGVAKIKSGGWQGNSHRQYNSNTNTNLVYSLGAGISYSPVARLNFDLGYRYVDSGKIESGMNAFQNGRNLQDEQMKAHLKSDEYYLGVRYLF